MVLFLLEKRFFLIWLSLWSKINEIDGQLDSGIYRYTDSQIARETDRLTDRQTDRRTNIQTDKICREEDRGTNGVKQYKSSLESASSALLATGITNGTISHISVRILIKADKTCLSPQAKTELAEMDRETKMAPKKHEKLTEQKETSNEWRSCT